MRYIAPYLLARFVRKAQENMMGNMQEKTSPNMKKEGEVNVDYVPKKKKPGKKDDLGDYTDFEEFKE